MPDSVAGAPADEIARLDGMARRVGTPCGDGEMVWRLWGAGPPVVLFHGNFGTWLHWIRNVEALADRYTVIAIDAPGFGGSAMPPVPCTARDYGAIVAEGLGVVLEDLFGGKERARLVPFSFGGRLAGEVAVLTPERLHSVTFVAPGGLGIEDAPWPELAKLRSRMTPDEVAAAHRHNLAAMMIADPDKVDDLAILIQDRNTSRARFRMTSWPEDDRWENLARALPQITVPMQGIWSGRDAFAGHTMARRIALLKETQPDADIRVMDTAGHWMFYEQADAFNAIVLEMLDR